MINNIMFINALLQNIVSDKKKLFVIQLCIKNSDTNI